MGEGVFASTQKMKVRLVHEAGRFYLVSIPHYYAISPSGGIDALIAFNT